MSCTPLGRPWPVLVVSNSDRTLTTVRSQVRDHIESLDFAVTTWEGGGFPFVAGSSAHEVSIELANGAEVLVAVIGSYEGTALRIDDDHMRPDLRAVLEVSQVTPPGAPAGTRLPTILEAEILTGIGAGIPTAVLVEKEARDTARRVRTRIASQLDRLHALVAVSPPAEALVREGRWRELGWWYDGDDIELEGMSFRRACFLIDLDSGTPYVGVKPVDIGKPADIDDFVRGVLGQAAALVASSPRWRGEDGPIGRMIASARNPLSPESLRVLVRQALFVEPPFTVDGQEMPDQRLGSYLASQLRDDRSVAVVGDPGLGKTTAHLLAAQSACEMEPPRSVLAGRWRDLPADADALMPAVLGIMRRRNRWPIAIPSGKWIVALDGLDESKLGVGTSVELIRSAHTETDAAVLVTCRAQSWERSFHPLLGGEFDRIVTLSSWGPDQIDDYLARLRASGRDAAATAIEDEFLSSGAELEFLAYPLWLSMLAYLLSDPSRRPSNRSSSDVDVLGACADAVAADERKRAGLDSESNAWLQDKWGAVAWRLHVAKGPLGRERLLDEVGVPASGAHQAAVHSVLDMTAGGEEVSGFFHQVFADFWMARHIANRIVRDDTEELRTGNPDEVRELFSFHRSRLVNRLVRGYLNKHEWSAPATESLRAAFDATAESEVFTRNQLVYLMSRVGPGEQNRAFLANIWRTADDEFVRYSAGFAATIAGASEVEQEFYEALVAGGQIDAIARGYHRVYYGDLPEVDESRLPYYDEDTGSARRAQRNLIRRLQRPDAHCRALRRVETVILRRLVETHGIATDDVVSVVTVADQVVVEARSIEASPFAESLAHEATELVRAARALRSGAST